MTYVKARQIEWLQAYDEDDEFEERDVGPPDPNIDPKTGKAKPLLTPNIMRAFREYDRRIKWKYNEELRRYEMAIYGLSSKESEKLTAFLVKLQTDRGVTVTNPRKPKDLPYGQGGRNLILDID